MRRLVPIVPLLALAGCLASAPQPPVNWLVETAELPRFSAVTVAAPYDDGRLPVLRADGSIAFDPCNAFAARPSQLLRNALTADRSAPFLFVERLALDCREASRRDAVAEVTLVTEGRTLRGSARVPTADGDYSAAFTRAVGEAVKHAK